MVGVGENAFVKELAWQADKDDSFDVVVMVTVTSLMSWVSRKNKIKQYSTVKIQESLELPYHLTVGKIKQYSAVDQWLS